MAEIDVGMPKADIKKLLVASPPDNPCRVAAGVHKAPGLAYIRIAKSGDAHALAAALKKEFNITAVSSGSVLPADKDLGPGLDDKQRAEKKLAVFRMEKALPGLAKRLKKSLKGTGFSKAIIIYGDGTSDADMEDEEGEAAEGQEAAGTAPEASAVPPAPPAPPAPEAAPAAQAPTLDAGALKKRLAAAIPRVAGADAAHKAELMQLVTNAKTQLDANNLAPAGVFIDELEAKLAQASGAPAGGSATGAVAFGKSRLIWIATRKKMETDLQKLRAEINTTYKDNPVAGEIDSRYSTTIAPVLATLDEQLADKLDDVVNEADATKRAALIEEAKTLINNYRTFVTTEPLFADLDSNPFVPLAIRDTVSKTLDAIAASVH